MGNTNKSLTIITKRMAPRTNFLNVVHAGNVSSEGRESSGSK